jgi:hypothetical protein
MVGKIAIIEDSNVGQALTQGLRPSQIGPAA